MLPKLSIITPSFNQGKFLERTILSVLNQNYPNLEYIIIDGGSIDSSVEIIKKYEKSLSYWVSEPDKGQSHAINKGFKMATGDYVGWLNSDDELNDNSLNYLSKSIEKNHEDKKDVVLYYGILQLIDEHNKHIKFEPFNETIDFRKSLYAKSPTLQPGSFITRKAIAEVGFLNENLHFCMDWDLWLRLLKIGDAQFIPHVMAKLRVHSAAKSSNKTISNLKESFEVFRSHKGSYISKQFLRYFYFFSRYALTGRVIKKSKNK
jgi:glycosyltransferase involved in cell wall biosynthesis